MAEKVRETMDMRQETRNNHLQLFYKLLDKHFERITAHVTYKISSDKVE